MKRHRLLLPALLLGLVLIAGIAASASQGETDKKTGSQASGEVTLSGWASSPTETKLLKEVIRGFERTFPSIKVNYAPISGDFTAAMLAKFAARKPPDVLYVDSNVAPDWIKQRVLDPLDTYISQSKLKTEAFYPSLLNGFKGPDRQDLRLPEGLVAARDGDQQPTHGRGWGEGARRRGTSFERRRGSSSSKVPGGRPICLSPSWDRMLAFVYQNGGTFLNATKTKSTVNTPAVPQAAEFYVGPDQPGSRRHAGPARRRLVRRGARQGEGRDRLRGQLGRAVHGRVVPERPLHRATRWSEASRTGTSRSPSRTRWPATRRTRPAAWQLIRYLVGQPGMKTWTSKGLALPSRRDVKPVAGRQPSSPRLRPHARGSSRRRSRR